MNRTFHASYGTPLRKYIKNECESFIKGSKLREKYVVWRRLQPLMKHEQSEYVLSPFSRLVEFESCLPRVSGQSL